MTASWQDLEGVTIGKFEVQTFVRQTDDGAYFIARTGACMPLGLLRLALDSPATQKYLEQWRVISGMAHPNLVQIYETGRVERGLTAMGYALMELPDEDLAGVLRERPLNQVEAQEAALEVANALRYLHSRSLVHGRVAPPNIVAVGNTIKLLSDSIAPPAPFEGPAEDMRGLGACLYAMFTQRMEPDLDRLSEIPQPFRNIVRGCCEANTNERWTAERVVGTLDLASLPEPPMELRRAPEPMPPPVAARPPERVMRKWVLAPAALAVGLLVLGLTSRSGSQSTAPTRPVVVKPMPTPAPSAPPPSAPVTAVKQPVTAPETPATRDTSATRIWRVITYTYNRAEDAARMVSEINRRWPQLRAEQFSLNPASPPYLVALGGRMTRTEALRLQQRAITAGLPPDTFVRNFKR
jgi:hypothetical protein